MADPLTTAVGSSEHGKALINTGNLVKNVAINGLYFTIGWKQTYLYGLRSPYGPLKAPGHNGTLCGWAGRQDVEVSKLITCTNCCTIANLLLWHQELIQGAGNKAASEERDDGRRAGSRGGEQGVAVMTYAQE